MRNLLLPVKFNKFVLIAALVVILAGYSSAQEGAYVNSQTVTQGDTLKFYISTASNPFDLRITRYLSIDYKVRITDYYSLPGGLRAVPSDAYINGCRWPETFRIVVPDTWEPGMYRATFPNSVGGGGVIFFVKAKNPGSYSNTLVILNTNTWQAYNAYGGKSLYPSTSPNRSYKVSFLRPSTHLWGAYFFFAQELKFTDWMYKNNTKIEYASDFDVHSDPTLLSKYKVVVVAGHGEYWSNEQRTNFQNYINSGGKMMILSGNTAWWQVRFEDNGNTLVCYKNSTVDPLTGIADSLVTVNWYAPPVNKPENSLIGVSFRNGGYVNNGSTLPASQGYGDYAAFNTHHWVYGGTNLKDGDEFGTGSLIVGNEVDGAVYKWENGLPVVTGTDGTPLNYTILGLSPSSSSDPTVLNEHGVPGIYTNPAGGAVFNSATLKWVDGLLADNTVKQITSNVYTRFLKNTFPPDIVYSSPHVIENKTINNEVIPVVSRTIMVENASGHKFSVKAVDYKNSAVSFKWMLNNNEAGNDSVYNFVPGTDSLNTLTVYVYNSTDTASLTWIVRAQVQTQIPSVPVLISPANNAVNLPLDILLEWNAAAGAQYYEVQVSEDPQFGTVIVNESTASTSRQITLPEYGKTYYWKVRSGNSAGTSDFSTVWSFSRALETLQQPANFVQVSPARNQKNLPLNVAFKWRNSERAEYYRLQVGIDKQLKTLIYNDSLITDTSVTLNIFQTKRNYWWRVAARNSAGVVQTPIWQFTTGTSVSAAFTGLTVEMKETNIILSWIYTEDENDGLFEIQKKSSGEEWITTGTVSYSGSDYIYEDDYSYIQSIPVYRIIYTSPEGFTEFSDEVSVTLLPDEFGISQNFPNPFNPATTIEFMVPVESSVSIKLYDINGEYIKTLMEETKKAGSYTLNFSSGNLASGVYFYRFFATVPGTGKIFTDVKKLIIMK